MKSKLQQLLQTMRVPTKHRFDIEWLARNLRVENKDHPNLPKAMKLIRLELKKRIEEME